MIKRLLPRTSYERESLIKAFGLFFVTMNLFLGVIFFLIYEREVTSFKNALYLRMKTFSYTFEGEEFKIDLVPSKGQPTYELMEDQKGLYILIPIPGVKEDLLKILYPIEKFREDLSSIRKKILLSFVLSCFFASILSAVFALYAINPLREALRIIEEVTRDIIHDINTPLMTLMVNLKLLKKKHNSEEVDRALLALKQLQSLKENLKPMVTKAELNFKEVDLEKLLREEVETISRIYPETEVEVHTEKVKLRADEEATRRILSNLIDNAFKHSLHRSWIRIVLKKDRLIIENPSREIKNPHKLFERFYRESQRGLGLGLSIVRKLCKEMGWEVKLHYEEGIFRVEILFR